MPVFAINRNLAIYGDKITTTRAPTTTSSPWTRRPARSRGRRRSSTIDGAQNVRPIIANGKIISAAAASQKAGPMRA